MSVYRVTGNAAYRGHQPGDVFIGELEPQIEARAIARGAITVESRIRIGLDAERAVLPRGWTPKPDEQGA